MRLVFARWISSSAGDDDKENTPHCWRCAAPMTRLTINVSSGAALQKHLQELQRTMTNSAC